MGATCYRVFAPAQWKDQPLTIDLPIKELHIPLFYITKQGGGHLIKV